MKYTGSVCGRYEHTLDRSRSTVVVESIAWYTAAAVDHFTVDLQRSYVYPVVFLVLLRICRIYTWSQYGRSNPEDLNATINSNAINRLKNSGTSAETT